MKHGCGARHQLQRAGLFSAPLPASPKGVGYFWAAFGAVLCLSIGRSHTFDRNPKPYLWFCPVAFEDIDTVSSLGGLSCSGCG